MSSTMHGGKTALVASLLAGTLAAASEIGQQVASRINPDTYRYYLSGRLYTHDGDDRSSWPSNKGPQHDPARDNIVATFQSFGLSVVLEGVDADGQFFNVVATQTGTLYPDSYYVVGAHYDSAWTPGADDDASGVAGLLEIARVMSLYATEYTIKYIAFDQEEQWMVGSAAYVQAHLTDDIRGMVQLDMIAHDIGGYAGEIHGVAQSDPIKLALADALSTYASGLTVTVDDALPSDHVPFEQAGFQACALIESNYFDNPCYHHPCDSVDTPDYISYGYAADFARSVAGFLADQTLAQPLFDCATGTGCESGTEDCDSNGVWDVCDVVCGGAPDCNANLIPDVCDLASGTSADCNANGLLDECDIAGGASQDINRNGIPDECEPNHTWYVDAAAGPTGDGSAEHPFDTIWDGILASISGDTVIVRPGVYSSWWNYNLDFGGREITLMSETGPQNCIIDPMTWSTVPLGGFYFHHHETAAARVSGFTIRNTTQFYYPYGGPPGGAIYCYQSSPTIENCIIKQCSGETAGAAISCEGADPTIIGCVIVQNQGVPGAIWCYAANPIIVDTIITDNAGPGIYCIEAGPAVVDCLLARNEYGIGGSVRNASLANCTITAHAAWGITWQAENGQLVNCLLWGNAGPALDLQAGDCTARFCDIQGGWPGTGNIDLAPLFVTGDSLYHIQELSPCVNAGDPDGDYAGQADLDGDPRVLFGRVDIGADEVAAITDCNGNNTPDALDIANGTSQDCNYNGVPDECDLAGGTSLDCNANGRPDECDLIGGYSFDCNANGIPDECDLASGASLDCNSNGVPDECDLAGGTSLDCNGNGVPDECEPDCNSNGVPDDCDVAHGTSPDCNFNGVPDECDLADETSLDCNSNGIPDECDIASGMSTDVNCNGLPDECESVGDLNCDGVTDFADINPFVLYLSNFAAWQVAFPGCNPANGDINGDGTYGQGSLSDINPFVELLTHP